MWQERSRTKMKVIVQQTVVWRLRTWQDWSVLVLDQLVHLTSANLTVHKNHATIANLWWYSVLTKTLVNNSRLKTRTLSLCKKVKASVNLGYKWTETGELYVRQVCLTTKQMLFVFTADRNPARSFVMRPPVLPVVSITMTSSSTQRSIAIKKRNSWRQRSALWVPTLWMIRDVTEVVQPLFSVLDRRKTFHPNVLH